MYRSCKRDHGQTSALMGMVRLLVPPNRLTLLAPSEQPLPNEKPQPPRRSKVFSAYSRCVLGITKRSRGAACHARRVQAVLAQPRQVHHEGVFELAVDVLLDVVEVLVLAGVAELAAENLL